MAFFTTPVIQISTVLLYFLVNVFACVRVVASFMFWGAVFHILPALMQKHIGRTLAFSSRGPQFKSCYLIIAF